MYASACSNIPTVATGAFVYHICFWCIPYCMGLHLLCGHDILMGQVGTGFIYPVNFAEARCRESQKVIFVVAANDYF